MKNKTKAKKIISRVTFFLKKRRLKKFLHTRNDSTLTEDVLFFYDNIGENQETNLNSPSNGVFLNDNLEDEEHQFHGIIFQNYSNSPRVVLFCNVEHIKIWNFFPLSFTYSIESYPAALSVRTLKTIVFGNVIQLREENVTE